MTTIVFKDGWLAADRRCCDHQSDMTKLHKMRDGSWCAMAGEVQCCLESLNYLNDAGALPPNPENSVLIIRAWPDGKVVCYESRLVAMDTGLPFYAKGSGANYAMGAMAMGATAKQAVEVASRFDYMSGNGIDVIQVF